VTNITVCSTVVLLLAYISVFFNILSALSCVICQCVKGKVSSKMTYNFYWPDRISIFFENFL